MQSPFTTHKIASWCQHPFTEGEILSLETKCKRKPGVIHKVSFLGSMCKKCMSALMKRDSESDQCLVCTEKIIQGHSRNELCDHDYKEISQVQVACQADKGATHEIPFANMICVQCADKVRAAFAYIETKKCPICQGSEEEVLLRLERILTLPASRFIKAILKKFDGQKINPQVYQKELEGFCRAKPQPKEYKSLLDPSQFKSIQDCDSASNHQSKRYILYPKCQIHREFPLSLCNNCIVSVVQQNCPYGCGFKEEPKKLRTGELATVCKLGFLHLAPKNDEKGPYLELIVIQLKQERDRVDRWRLGVRKVRPHKDSNASLIAKLPFYSTIIEFQPQVYMVSGGMVGPNIDNFTTSSSCFFVQVFEENGTLNFDIGELAPMSVPRSGHSLVFHQAKNTIYAIGGFNLKDGHLAACEVYSVVPNTWSTVAPLNIPRSRTSAFWHKDSIFVLGGLSSSQKYMQNPIQYCGEKYSFETSKWELVTYNGFRIPEVTGAVSSSSLLSLRTLEPTYLFGGSNFGSFSECIYQFKPNGNKFDMSYVNGTKLQSVRFGCTMGLMTTLKPNQYILVMLGGLQEHEPAFNIDAFHVRIDNNELTLVYAYDDVNMDSYQYAIRQNKQAVYDELYADLVACGLLKKREKPPPHTKESGALKHLIEKLYYSGTRGYLPVQMPVERVD